MTVNVGSSEVASRLVGVVFQRGGQQLVVGMYAGMVAAIMLVVGLNGCFWNSTGRAGSEK